MLDPVSIDRKISTTEFGNNHRIHLPNDECEDPYEEDEESQESETLEDSCREFVSLFSETFWNLILTLAFLHNSDTCLVFPH